MYRIRFNKGELRTFIQSAENTLGLSLKEIAKKLDISERTLRDWKREKFNPNGTILIKLSKITHIPLPKYKALDAFWYTKKAAKLGGKKRFELYGQLGNSKTRSKGGTISWLKRKNNPNILKKYQNVFAEPKESIDFAEFIGIMLGDGGITKDQITIYLHSITDKKYSKYVARLIKKLFNFKASIHKVKKSHLLRISISGVNIVKYLVGKGLKIGNKVHLQVGVPTWIEKNNEYIRACIRGLIDTDGCFVIHRYCVDGKQYEYPKISFANKSEPILDFVYRGLTKLEYHPKRTYKFDIWLYNQNEVRKYLEEIGVHNIKPNVNEILYGGVR